MIDLTRAYLVVPKLIEQPTWGGDYIVKAKEWQNKNELSGVKIGQSYELFSHSTLSQLTSSLDPDFSGELRTPKNVVDESEVENTIPLSDLISENAVGTLGAANIKTHGPVMHLLIKFTQALGNSFQLHIKDGTTHAKWKPKPESWYFFEPGVITLGIKPETDWGKYQTAVSELDQKINQVSQQIKSGKLSLEEAREKVKVLVSQYNPWQYVNTLFPKAEELIDLSSCGIHHSWEEDASKAPLGNIVYELQLNVLDEDATIRNFDKGKMSTDGSTRPLQIEDYFKFVDRSSEANNPATHSAHATIIEQKATYTLSRLLQTKYYTLDKLQLKQLTSFQQEIETFRHVFVKEGRITVQGTTPIHVSRGHAAFVPATAKNFEITASDDSEVLVSY